MYPDEETPTAAESDQARYIVALEAAIDRLLGEYEQLRALERGLASKLEPVISDLAVRVFWARYSFVPRD